MSVFTIKYFGLSMRAAHLKAAVKEQVSLPPSSSPSLSLCLCLYFSLFLSISLSLSSLCVCLFFQITPQESFFLIFSQMCRKLVKELQAEMLEYTKNFVIVEMMEHAHRIVSRR